MIFNVYEGCMISLIWNYAPEAQTLSNVQIDRATYAIQSHTNFAGDLSTEFQTINKTTYNWSTSSYYGDYYSGLRSTYYPSCYSYPYYWHPYKKWELEETYRQHKFHVFF